MLFSNKNRLAIAIDGVSLFSASKGLGFDVDYRKVKDEFALRGNLLRASYYTTFLESDGYTPVKPLIDFLDFNGYSTACKPAREYTDSAGRTHIRGSIEVELTVDALELAPRLHDFVIFSGNIDFMPLVSALKRRGVRVTICSTTKSTAGAISDDFRRTCDHFIELNDLKETIARDPKTGVKMIENSQDAVDPNGTSASESTDKSPS